MVKICHIADTHIRMLERHDEYREIFKKIYKILQQEKPDIIIHCGDLYHSKTRITNEYVSFAAEFLKSLADIAPTIVIPGNHDGNLKNKNRMDSISPIVDILQHKNLYYWKNSGEHSEFANMGIMFSVLSIFDKENWIQKPSEEEKINIALFHGSISGVETDTGWVMEYGEEPIEIFQPYDYALLGDIHRTNQMLDEDGRIRYCGSTIQQNHGETDDKGFLIWDIKDKKKFSVKHFPILNPKPFLTIALEPNGTLQEDITVPPLARLRVITEYNLPIDTIRKSVDIAKTRFNPETITFLNKADDDGSSVEITDSFKKEDLRSETVQENLIKEYLKDYHISDDLYGRIFDINKKFNTIIESNETSVRNLEFKVKSFEWDNLFNYGSGNKIDFSNLNGTVGIFGKNFTGKSSIIDGFLYTIFNFITKNSRKKTKIINKDCNIGSGKVVLQVEDKEYTIKRISEKYVKKLHGSETIEAKTSLDFSVKSIISGEEENLNGIDRNETDKNIAKYFGSFDDFVLTSISSQLGALSYIDKGSTERKEILAKFLDVDIFSQKFDLASKESADVKAVIKKLEGKKFETELQSSEIQLMKNTNAIQECENSCTQLRNDISALEKEVIVLHQQIKSSPDEFIDIEKLHNDIRKKNDAIKVATDAIEAIKSKNSDNETKNARVSEFINNFDINALKEKQEIIHKHEVELNEIIKSLKDDEKDLSHDVKKVSLLKEVPCGSEYSHCKFIKGAYEAQEQVSILELAITNKNKERDSLSETIKKLDPEKVSDQLSKYNILLDKKNSFIRELALLKSQLDLKVATKSVQESELAKLCELEQKYEANKEKIEKIEKLNEELSEKETILSSIRKEFTTCDNSLKEFYKNKGFLEQSIQKLTEEKNELNSMRSDYEAYDLFMKCMNPSGISYDIIKRSLPNINSEISKILSSIVDFQIFFENEDNKLEIYMKKPQESESLPIEMGSGAQKCIAAMAIRLAFIRVSSLPKSDIFILDEPGTSLDEDNMEGFIRMLELIKSNFKCVILISHLDSLKDTADSVISIQNKDGFAHVCL